MVRGGGVGRNTVFNILGHLAPMAAGLAAMPVLTSRLGAERFGLLALVWILTGYLSLLDLGLSRGLTQLVAERTVSRRTEGLSALVRVSFGVLFVFGVGLGGLLLGCSSRVADWLRVSPTLQAEIPSALAWLACGLPFVMLTGGVRGVLEAYQRFDLVNLLRVPLGVFTYAGPMLVTLVTPDLGRVVAVLTVGRVVACAAHLGVWWSAVPGAREAGAVRRADLRPLLQMGGWISLSNVLSPIMVYFDRFVIGALLSLTAVAYYVTPYEAITRVLVIPGALGAVLFPVFAMSGGGGGTAQDYFSNAVVAVMLTVLPVGVVGILFAEELLHLWLGPIYAQESARVLRWLALGVIVNAVAVVPFTFIQGMGRADLTGKLHFIELPLYLGLLWMLTPRLGIAGVAIAWTLRVTLDAIGLFALAARLQRRPTLRIMGRLDTLLWLSIVLSMVWFAESIAVRWVLALGVGFTCALLSARLYMRKWRPTRRDEAAGEELVQPVESVTG